MLVRANPPIIPVMKRLILLDINILIYCNPQSNPIGINKTIDPIKDILILKDIKIMKNNNSPNITAVQRAQTGN